MTVAPSCPALLIHEDDLFRRKLIATLDQRHFTVTIATDGQDALDMLRDRARSFNVILLGLDLARGSGVESIRFLSDHRETIRCGVIILGDPDPELRTYTPWADETLMKPVDADYVASRAQAYCHC